MLYDVIGDQLGGAMSAVVEKLRVMEKEGLLREGKQSFITMSWPKQLDDCSGGCSESAVATSYCCKACSSSSLTWLSGSGSKSSSHPSLNHA